MSQVLDFVKCVSAGKRFKEPQFEVAFPRKDKLESVLGELSLLEAQWLDFFCGIKTPVEEFKKAFIFNEVLHPMNEYLTENSFFGAGFESLIDFALFYYVDVLLQSSPIEEKDIVKHFPAVMRWVRYFQERSKSKIHYIPKFCLVVQEPASFSDFLAANLDSMKIQVESNITTPKPAPQVKKPAQDKPKSKTAPKKKEKKPAKPAAQSSSDDQPEVTKLEIRIGQITAIEKHPDREKLYVEQISFGEETRTIISGLVEFYPDPSVLLNKKVLVMMNLKPRAMGSVTSNGMVLCASNEDKSLVEIIEPPSSAEIGEVIAFQGLNEGKPDVFKPWAVNKVNKKKVLEKTLPNLTTNNKGEAQWMSHVFLSSAGPCAASSIVNGKVA